MRFLPFLVLVWFPAIAAEFDQPKYPLWDGRESIVEYARRAHLPPTKTLDLGNGVSLELALIPAGKCSIQTPKPDEPWIGFTLLAIGGVAALGLLAIPMASATRNRRRPQFSLGWLILLIVALGLAQYGGFRWRRAEEAQRLHSEFSRSAYDLVEPVPFYLGKFEVTQEQYQQLMGVNLSKFEGSDRPVDQALWKHAIAFCQAASAKLGLPVRLPAGTEWEYACRAGTTTVFHTGDSESDLARAGWYDGNAGNTTHPVGQKTPNAWGLYDMHGNVWDLCSDRVPAPAEPAGTDPPEYYMRGGSCYTLPRFCRSDCGAAVSLRMDRGDFVGFRVLVPVAP
jgi:hypothetical protein